MPNTTRGVGLFTAENIVAVIRAIPESDGTYRDVVRKAKRYQPATTDVGPPGCKLMSGKIWHNTEKFEQAVDETRDTHRFACTPEE